MSRFIKLIVICCAFCFAITSYSAPVEVNVAKTVALNFMQYNKAFCYVEDAVCELEYTCSDADNYFYVFNINDKGFVIVSAQDIVKPILAYSTESTFNKADIPDNMACFLNDYQREIVFAIDESVVKTSDIAAEWADLLNTRSGLQPKGERVVEPLLTTLWRQHWPYNYYCPEDPAGSGGHCYVGCVAMALGMIMKYWEYPVTGTGSHSYYCSGYGSQSANFGEATYLYDLMPYDSLRLASPLEEIEATALMLYHCGVAVDMQYGTSGSGAYVFDIPDAAVNYFGFSEETEYRQRSNYSLNEWVSMLKEQFDLGYPVYYGAYDYNVGVGHAFNLDGYDENDMFHINWGWGGNQNGYFAVDAFNTTNYSFNDGNTAIFDMIPDYVYGMTPTAPTNFLIVPDPDYNLSATISWTNPSTTFNGNTLESIDSMMVMRDGAIIDVIYPTTPGEEISIVDNTVPEYGSYTYSVYAMTNIGIGYSATQTVVIGPSCTIIVEMNDSYGDGWNGASLSFRDASGEELANLTLVSGSSETVYLQLLIGTINCFWNSGSWDSECSFSIYDFENNAIYTSQGTPQAGEFFSFENECDVIAPCLAPTSLIATASETENKISLQWTGMSSANTYNIYRDEAIIAENIAENQYEDENLEYMTEYCYHVVSVCDNGESQPSTAECATTPLLPLPCNPPENVHYELINNTIVLQWDGPDKDLSCYNVFLDGETVAECITASSYTYTNVEDGEEYVLGVSAVYSQQQCGESDVVEVTALFIGIDNYNEVYKLYPNPASDVVNIKADGQINVVVINMLGQVVKRCEGYNSVEVDVRDYPRGVYIFQIVNGKNINSKRVVVR